MLEEMTPEIFLEKKKNSEVDKRKKYTVTKLKNTKNKRMS